MFIHAENLYSIFKGKEDDFSSLKLFFIKFCYNQENRNKFDYKKIHSKKIWMLILSKTNTRAYNDNVKT